MSRQVFAHLDEGRLAVVALRRELARLGVEVLRGGFGIVKVIEREPRRVEAW